MITFNNIAASIRTPGAYVEIDNSRALKGLAQNPHKVLILGQKETAGTASKEVLYAVNNDAVAESYFGAASILARMVRSFKLNNPNTELYAMALSEAGTAGAAAAMSFTGSATRNGTLYLMLGGDEVQVAITSGMSAVNVAAAVKAAVNANSRLCAVASNTASTIYVLFSAVGSGVLGNYYDIRTNYYEGQSDPAGVGYSITGFAGGTGNPTMSGAWAIIDTEQFQHVIHPYVDSTSLGSIETELSNRFGPMVDMQGFGYTAVRGTLASCTTLGNARNSPHHSIIGAYDSPTNPEIWAAALGAVCSMYLNDDPARPLHYLELKGILPPPVNNRFTRAERDTILYDGISTFIVSGGKVLIERPITTYQTNALGMADASYLDINTMFTLMELRFQFKTRMANRFIIPRFKLADDTFPVQPGTFIATPKTVKQEIVALFTLLRDKGLIENLEDFVKNLVVERDATDVNRVNVLLPPDLINQFRVLAGQIQFIL
jgi:phage tail sheath gpL-like